MPDKDLWFDGIYYIGMFGVDGPMVVRRMVEIEWDWPAVPECAR